MIDIKFDMKDVETRFARAAEQIPFALSKAVNDLAFMVRKAEMETAARVFDRPKPQTVKNFFVRKGTKSSPMATIWFDQIYDRGYEEYMTAQAEGGQRQMKRSEVSLGRYYVPGMGAKMDQYGNMQGGQVTQILSRLGRFKEVGWQMNETVRSKKRRYGGSKASEYFMITSAKNGLKPGVYMRTEKRGGFTSMGTPRARRGASGAFQSGAGGAIRARGVVPVMVFTKKAPSYSPRFPFHDVARNVINRNFGKVMGAAVDFALRTRR